MKKKILILSAAMLAVVVGAALLQSCSSESAYEEPAYGYYTEEEINVVKAMAEAYGLSFELNEDYYGPKKTLHEFENEMIGLSALTGEYEMIPQRNRNGELTFTSQRKDEVVSRSVTRYIESDGKFSDVEDCDQFEISVTVKWEGDGTASGAKASGSSSVRKTGIANNSDRSPEKSLRHCMPLGDSGITFEGEAEYYEYIGILTIKEKDENGKIKEKKKAYFIKYTFEIRLGEINTNTNTGSFIVRSAGNSNYYEDI